MNNVTVHRGVAVTWLVRPVAVGLAILLTGIAPGSLVAGALESVFQSSSTGWTSYQPRSEPTFTTLEKGSGFLFPCDFAQVTDRCNWDAVGLDIDLSTAISLSAWVHVENATAISQMTLYFKSGPGWYARGFPVNEGWTHLVANLDTLGREGQPEGLHKIDGLRVSLWKLTDERAAVTLVGLSASPERAQEPAFEWPEHEKDLKRVVRRDDRGRLLESRMMMDEAPFFLIEGQSSEAVLDKLTRAGFHVYMPCVWHGRGAMYRSEHGVLDARYADKFKGISHARFRTTRNENGGHIGYTVCATCLQRGRCFSGASSPRRSLA